MVGFLGFLELLVRHVRRERWGHGFEPVGGVGRKKGVGCAIGARGVSPENCYAHTCELYEPHRCAGACLPLGETLTAYDRYLVRARDVEPA